MAHSLRIGPQGRIVIPAVPRRALGWQPGDELVAWVDGKQLILLPRDAVEQELWDHCSRAAGLADQLIVDRRREAAREAAAPPASDARTKRRGARRTRDG